MTSLRLDAIDLDAIDAGARLRPLDPAHVELIAASIEEIGLSAPISVRPAGDGYRLIAGAHRLAALKTLGWTALKPGREVIVRTDCDALAAQIEEIDENLARHELNALDRALFLVERKKLYEEKFPQTKHGGDRKSLKVNKKSKSHPLRLDLFGRFSKVTALRTGLSERTIQLAVEIASRLDGGAISILRGTGLERRQNELISLSRLEAEEQRAVARLIAEGSAKTVSAGRAMALGRIPPKTDKQEIILDALLGAWLRAAPQTRKRFLREVDCQFIPLAGKKGGRQ